MRERLTIWVCVCMGVCVRERVERDDTLFFKVLSCITYSENVFTGLACEMIRFQTKDFLIRIATPEALFGIGF